MFSIKRWFNPGPKGQVVHPLRPLLQAMEDKDPALRAEIGSMKPSDALKRWREVYPEDFAMKQAS